MKKIAIIYLAVLSLTCFMSCSDQEYIPLENSINSVNSTLQVSVEAPPSRSVIDFYGTYFWSANDTISVFGSKTFNAPYKIVNQTDRSTTFTGHLETIEEAVNFSFYPYNEDVGCDGNQIAFNLPIERKALSWERSPMVGLVEGTSNLRFYHAGGTLNIRIVGLPEHASILEVESEGENALYLSGRAIIENYKDDFTYRIVEGNHRVIYDVSKVEKAENLVQINLPLQVGHYDKLTVTLKDQTGAVIKKHSVSDLTVERAGMTCMPVINYSDTYYVYQLPEEVLKESELIEAYVTSDQMFIGVDTLDGCYHYTITQLQAMQQGIENVAHIYADENGFIQNITVNDKTAFFERNEDNMVKSLIIDGEKAEEINDLDVDVPNSSRAVESSGVYTMSQIATAMGWISSLGTAGSLGTGIKNAATWLLGSPLSTAFISDLTTGMIVGGSMSIGLGLLGLAALPATALTVGGSVVLISTVIGISAGLVSVASGAWNGVCQMIFNSVCGDMSVATLKPHFVDNSYYEAGYEFKNAERHGALEQLLGKWFIPECGLLKQPVEINSEWVPRPQVYKFNRELPERVANLSENVKRGNLSYVPSYKYYLTSYITFENKYFVAYYGNTELLTTNVSIDKVDFFSTFLKYEDEKFYFTITSTCNSESEYLSFYLNLYKDGEVCDSKIWSRENNKNNVEFELEVTPEELNMEDLSYKGQVALGITTTEADKENILSSKLVDLYYNEKASLEIDSVSIGETRKNGSRSLFDNNEEDYYETDVTVRLKYIGGGWFKSYGINTSRGDIWDGTESIMFNDYFVVCTGTIKYSENQQPPSLSCFGILRNEKRMNGKGTVIFEGIPISKAIVQ